MRKILSLVICLTIVLGCFGVSFADEWNPELANWNSPALSYKTGKSNGGYTVQSSYLNRVLKVQATRNGWSQLAATTAGDYSFSVNTDQLDASSLTISVYRYLDNNEDPQLTDTLTFRRGQGVVTQPVRGVLAGQQLLWTQSISDGSYLLMISPADLSGIKGEASSSVSTVVNTTVARADARTGTPILTRTPSKGDTFYMGWYEQDNNFQNGRERIEWVVLDVDERADTVLVISKLALDCKIYHPVRASVSWGDTYLRNWLVNTFANSALNQNEQACIIPQRVAGVTDTVTMLDENQIAKYKLAVHGCDVSRYAANLDNPVNINSDGYGCWWVRMDKTTSGAKMQFVGRGGYVYAASKTDESKYLKKKGGNYTTSKDNGIRPAMLLSISALKNTKLGNDFAVLTGSVVNASNPTQKVEGARVTVNGETYITDRNGEFVAGVDIGVVRYSVQHNDYITIEDSITMTGGQQSVTIATSRRMAANEYRVVLTWGEYPRDLDSHLRGYTESGSDYHVAYYALRADGGKAMLEYDDTTSYGPETTHFFAYPGMTYTFCVHDYTNRGSSSTSQMAASGAKVNVFRGNEMIATYNVPSGGGTEWTVFTVVNNEIYPVNTMSYCSNPSDVGR